MNYNKYLLEYQTYIGKNGKTKYKFDSPEERQAYIDYRRASKAYYGDSYTDKKELRDDDREDFLSYNGSVKDLNRHTEYLNKGVENRKQFNNSEEENDDKPKKDIFASVRKGYSDPNSKNEEENKEELDDKGRPKRQPGEKVGDYRKRLKNFNAEQQQKYDMEREQREQQDKLKRQKQYEETQRRLEIENARQRQMGKDKQIRNLKRASIIGGTAVAAGIAGKIAFDRIQYNKYKKRHPNITFSQWKQLKKQNRLNESFLDGYYDALNYYL